MFWRMSGAFAASMWKLIVMVEWIVTPSFDAALAAYRAGRFGEAAAMFAAIADVDPPASVMAERARDLQAAPPPPPWDAVTTLEGLGFKSYILPKYGTDPDGDQHDMTKLVLRL